MLSDAIDASERQSNAEEGLSSLLMVFAAFSRVVGSAARTASQLEVLAREMIGREDRLISLSATAKLLDQHPGSIRRMVREKRSVEPVRVGKKIYFRRSDVSEWLARQGQAYEPPAQLLKGPASQTTKPVS